MNNKLVIFTAVLACLCLLSEASVRMVARCPGRARVRTNTHIGAEGSIDVRGRGSISWSVCDDKGHCKSGEDYYRGSRTRRNIRMFFPVAYNRRGGRSVTARLTAGGRTAIGRCSFVVS